MSEAVRNKAGDLIKKFIPMRRIGTPGRHRQGGGFPGQRGQCLPDRPGLTVDGGLSLGAVGAG